MMVIGEICSYIQKLKCLNESVLRWIDQHVRANPCCILSPVFRDYDHHVDKLNTSFKVTPDQLSSSSRPVRTDGLPATNTSTVARHSATVVSSTGMYFFTFMLQNIYICFLMQRLFKYFAFGAV